MDYLVSPVPGTYREKFRYGFPSDPLYIRYEVEFSDGAVRIFSIQKLSPGVYAMVDFGNSHQLDSHYTTWNRAYNGMQAVCKRICRRSFRKGV